MATIVEMSSRASTSNYMGKNFTENESVDEIRISKDKDRIAKGVKISTPSEADITASEMEFRY